MQIYSINNQHQYNTKKTSFKALKYSKKTLNPFCLTKKMVKENSKLRKLPQIFDISIANGEWAIQLAQDTQGQYYQFKKELVKNPTMLIKSDEKNQNAFHRVKDADSLREMIRTLKPHPSKLVDTLIKSDIDNFSPIHRMMENKELIYTLIEELKDEPIILARLLNTNAFSDNGKIICLSPMGTKKYTQDEQFVSLIKNNLGVDFYKELVKQEEESWQINNIKHDYDFEESSKLLAVRNPKELEASLLKTTEGNNMATTYYCDHNHRLSSKFLNEILKDEPEILANIYFNNDYQLLTILAKRADVSGIKGLFEIIKDNESALTKFYYTKFHYINNYIANIFGDDIEFKAKLKEAFAKIEEKINKSINNINFYNAEEALSFMRSEVVVESEGEILNETIEGRKEPILFALADIKHTRENAGILQDIALILKSLGKVNYFQKDSLGFNFFEKVLYTENESLLSAISGRYWYYSPEIENFFADIKDENFKNSAEKLKVTAIFPELLEAIELKSIKALELLENQFKSPFYDRYTVGAALWEASRKSGNEFRKAFCMRFKDYLPVSAPEDLLNSI